MGYCFYREKTIQPDLGNGAKVRNVPGKRSIRRKVEVDKIKNNAIVKKIGFNRVILIGVLILMYLLILLFFF